LTRDGQPIGLTPRTAALLLALLEGGGDVVDRDELDRRVWGETNVGLGSLPFQIHQLRRILGLRTDGGPIVENAPRRGYRIAVPIRIVDAGPDASRAAVVPDASAPPEVLQASPAPGRLRRRWANSLGYVAAVVVAIGSAAAIWRPEPVPRVTGVTAITRDGKWKDGPLKIEAGRVFYRDSSGLNLESVALDGGEPARMLGLQSGQMVLDFSAKRAEYLVTNLATTGARFDLWIVPSSGRPPRRVGSQKCQEAVWSPGGEHIACTFDDSLLVFDADGAAARVVMRQPQSHALWPRWSPDGERLSFAVSRARNRVIESTLWIARTDGSGARQLVTDWSPDRVPCCASWSPNGRYLAFVSVEDNQADLWLARTDARGASATTPDAVRLTKGPLQFTNPMWTPDGRVIALGVVRGGEMVRYDARLREFVPYLGGLSATWLSFSPDGRWMAYSSFPDNALWRARADGSDRQQLTPPLGVQESSWSPDGSRLAFRTEKGAGTPRLYLVARDGGPLQALPLPSPSVGMPTWSPDGQQLLTSDVPGAFGVPDGTERVRQYDLASGRWSVVPNSEGLWRARWSPDGRYIAALTIRDGQRLRLFDTTRRTWLASSADHVNGPNWSRDGRYIYYDAEANEYSLRRVRIPDGPVEELTSLANLSRAAYWWSGLSLEDDPILLRNIGAVELYALDVDGL